MRLRLRLRLFLGAFGLTAERALLLRLLERLGALGAAAARTLELFLERLRLRLRLFLGAFGLEAERALLLRLLERFEALAFLAARGSSLLSSRFRLLDCSSLNACLSASYFLYFAVFRYFSTAISYFFFAFSALSLKACFALSDMPFHCSPRAFPMVPISASGLALVKSGRPTSFIQMKYADCERLGAF